MGFPGLDLSPRPLARRRLPVARGSRIQWLAAAQAAPGPARGWLAWGSDCDAGRASGA